MIERLKGFFYECIRVFRVTRKPGTEEYKMVVKVTGIGILILGAIGFVISVLWQMFF